MYKSLKIERVVVVVVAVGRLGVGGEGSRRKSQKTPINREGREEGRKEESGADTLFLISTQL